MDETMLKQIQTVLGWCPLSADQYSIKDLNAFPLELAEAARQLSPMLRYHFMNHYVSADNSQFVLSFIEDVIEHGEDIPSWRRGRILVPAFSRHVLVQLSAEQIVAPLVSMPDFKWHQLKPLHESWEVGEFLTGAPAVLRPDLNYKYLPQNNVQDLLIKDTELIPVTDVRVATRRWVASNIAGVARNGNLLRIEEPAALVRACFPTAGQISADALISARGLIRELVSLPESHNEVPGFRGPDSWYKGEGEDGQVFNGCDGRAV
jgi:hypothetical protein